jgi:NhaA family Na+:H+ antiporter
MSLEQPPAPPSWVASDRPVPRLLVRPLREFLDTEVAGGVVLLGATVVALVWANSPWRESYFALWTTEIALRVGDIVLADDLRHWINDGAMALFFFVVGLELKRELIEGGLARPRDAALPVVGALGGMVAPALIYVAFNAGEPTVRGWGVPMATDIAFAVGILYVLGSRAPPSLRVFLLSLAIVDDVGTIVVIALFYSSTIDVAALLAALGGLAVVVLMRRLRVWWIPAYIIVGVVVWLATMRSGVHATMAGVALGLLTPVRPLHPERGRDPSPAPGGLGERRPEVAMARAERTLTLASVPMTEWLEHLLHPWTSYLVVPLFALANAGIRLDAAALERAGDSPVALGVAVGRLVGKPLGITLFVALGVRLGWGRGARGVVRWAQLGGAGTIAAVGFTVPLFVSALAFDSPALQTDVRVAMLASSLLGAVVGGAILAWSARRSPATGER